MLKFLVHDTVNDIAIIEGNFKLWLRYGLEQTEFEKDDMSGAINAFKNCVRHALHNSHDVGAP